MGAVATLNAEIKAIIDAMSGVTYMRAKEDEANKLINDMKVTDCLAIHIDLTAFASFRTVGSYNYKVIPIQILFVYKNTRIDDKTTAIDTLIDNAEDVADEFYDKLIQSSVLEQNATLDNPTYSRLEAYKRMDATVSGILFEWLCPVPRSTYYCAS